MKILMIGPIAGNYSGMTVANTMVFEGLKLKHDVVGVETNTDKEFSELKNQGKFNLKKVFASLSPIMKGCSEILFGNHDTVYITPAQSYFGFMKYSPFIILSKFKKKPCYIHFHGGFVRIMYDGLTQGKKTRIKNLFEKCTGIIVLGESLRSMFDGIVNQDKIFVAENGVNDMFVLNKQELDAKINRLDKNERIEILYLSNLMKTKGIVELLDAAILMNKDNISFHLHLAGNIESEVEDVIEEKITQLGNNVTYHGLVSGDKKKEILLNANVFCLPTYYPNEGQPISILEAMTTGCAIVTTYQGGIGDIFKDGVNGVVCDANAESIKDSLLSAYSNYEQYARGNYDESSKQYTSKAFVNKIEKILLNK